MRAIIPLIILLLGMTAMAATLEDAYTREARYLTALRALDTASDEQAKLTADPGATPYALTQAREKISEVRARLTVAEVQAKRLVIEIWENLLISRRQLAASEARLRLAQLQWQAAQIRHAAGAVSNQELARAKETLAKAEISAKETRGLLASAELRIKPYGTVTTQTPGEPAAPELDKLTVEGNPDLLAARHRAMAAERALALAQGPDTAALERTARERELQDARDALRDAEKKIGEQYDAARRGWQTAGEKYRVAVDAVTLAAAEVETAGKRHRAGAISTITLGETEAAWLDAGNQAERARLELWQAYFTLLETVGGKQ